MENKKRLMDIISHELQAMKGMRTLELLRFTKRGKVPVVRWDLITGGGAG